MSSTFCRSVNVSSAPPKIQQAAFSVALIRSSILTMNSLSRILLPDAQPRESDEMDAAFFQIDAPDGFIQLLYFVFFSVNEDEVRTRKQNVVGLLETHPWCFDFKFYLISSWELRLQAIRDEAASAPDWIAKQVDNLVFLLDILIHKRVAERISVDWAEQDDLSMARARFPAMDRCNLSRVTGRLFMAIGQGKLSPSPEATHLLLKNWLMPFYDDFALLKAFRAEECSLMEDGLSNTISTLTLPQPQVFLLVWADRFGKSGKNCCPNLRLGFETWWRKDSPNYPVK